MPLRPSDTFGRYSVERLLGEGKTGEVYAAVDQRLGRKVALKLIRKAVDGEARADGVLSNAASMLEEARTAASLRDPSIVAIYDAGELDGVPFLAMELVTGKRLSEIDKAELSLTDRLCILHDIAHCMSVVHQAGLVFRNVKSENIVVLPGNLIKILDLGVAPQTSRIPPPRWSSKEEAVDPPAYQAPEQLLGEPWGAPANQFVWGILAYELLSGSYPFRSNRGDASLVESIVKDELRALGRVRKGKEVPDGVARIVMRALEKRPLDRNASMADIADALLPFTDSPDMEAPLEAANAFAKLLQRAIMGVVALGFVATVVVVWLNGRPHSRAAPLLMAAFPKPVPTPVTELALPPTSSAEARSAYREGLQALRDGAWLVAYAAFDRATRLDTSLAGAWMRMALIIQDSDATLARGYFRKATMNRGLLGERDASLLDALEPIIQRTPSDLSEMVRRLGLLRLRFPGDAEIASLYAVYAVGLLPPEDALAAADTCLGLDPLAGDCLQVRARTLLRRLGRVEEGLATLERCIAATPGATDCFSDISIVHSSLGRCDLVELDARGWIARSQRSPVAHSVLASALFARDPRSPAVVEAALGAADRYHEHGLLGEEKRRRIEVTIATGHFEEAEEKLQAFLHEMADDPAEDAQAWPTYMLVSLFRETGRVARAGEVARDFLDRRSTMITGTVGLRWLDHSVFFWRARLDASLATPEEYESARSQFLAHHASSKRAHTQLAAWAHGHGLVATNEQDAKRALAAMPEVGAFRERRTELEIGVTFDAALGHVYFLLNDWKHAVDHLSIAASSCMGLASPFVQVKAILELGIAREALGERALACGAYRRVLARFSDAAGSKSAAEARARMAAGGCGL